MEYKLKISGSPRIDIAVVADLHNRECLDVITDLKHNDPNMILIPGAILDGNVYWQSDPGGILPDSVLRLQAHSYTFLKAAASIAPTYMSLGNHEWYFPSEDRKIVRDLGIHLLDNTYEAVGHVADRTGLPLYIGGLTSVIAMNRRKLIKEKPQLEKIAPLRKGNTFKKRDDTPDTLDRGFLGKFEKLDGIKILLSHHPEDWSLTDGNISERDIDLTISAHAHGGQCRILGQGLMAPGQGFFPKFTAGVVMSRKTGNRMVISRGLSNTAPIPRLNNPREIVYLKIDQDAT